MIWLLCNSYLSTISGPRDSLIPISWSCLCLVSCCSHAWLSYRTLVQFPWVRLVIWVSCILGLIYISMSLCHGLFYALQCIFQAMFSYPPRLWWVKLLGVGLYHLWRVLVWLKAQGVGWTVMTYCWGRILLASLLIVCFPEPFQSISLQSQGGFTSRSCAFFRYSRITKSYRPLMVSC